MANSVFIIDVCGTMFRSNTTFDFIRHYYGKEKKMKLWFSLPYRIYNRLSCKLFHREPLRHNLIGLLKGKPKDELEAMADTFVVQFLKRHEHHEVIQLIEEKRNIGLRLVIVSATIDVIAKAVAKHYNIQNWIATQLDYGEDGICRGRIKCDLLANKRNALEQIEVRPPYGGIITDNYSDTELIMSAEEPFLVDYTERGSLWSRVITKEYLNKCHIIKV